MQVLSFSLPPPDAERILRAQGADPDVIRTRNPFAAAAADAAACHGNRVVKSLVAFETRRVVALRHEKLELQGGGMLTGPLISRHLASADEVVVIVCSIGAALERAAAAAFDEDPAYGLALDVLGTLAVGDLSSAACAHFVRIAEEGGLQATMPLNPGLEGWPVDIGQHRLFALLGPRPAGVTVDPTGQMRPRKSVSLVLGIGRNVVSDGRPCDYCGLRATCRHQDQYV